MSITIDKAIEIKLQWRKDNYPPPLADEMDADMLSIEALKYVEYARNITAPFLLSPTPYPPLLPGETKEGD